jgi:hypothetical protein
MGSIFTIIASILGLVTYLIKSKDTPEGRQRARVKDREKRREELADIEDNQDDVDVRVSSIYDRLLRRKRRSSRK